MNQSSPSRRRSSTSRNSQSHEQPNLESSNPYEILGVPKNATSQQIKVSYRKLALLYHPDRLSPEASGEEKEGAHKSFTKIGHAYEILSDEGRRREYDAEQEQETTGIRFNRDPFGMNDSFFNSFTRSNMRHHSAFDEFHFMDPFELFNQFFSDELDQGNQQQSQHNSQRSRNRSAFDNDPFFGSDPFFSGFGGSMMSRQFGMMNEMNSMMQMHSMSMLNNQQVLNGNSSFFNSSSSLGRGGGQSVSTSTRTTIVNGVRTTVTERTVVHPDGRVERHVETGGGHNEALPASSSRPAIAYDDRRSGRRR